MDMTQTDGKEYRYPMLPLNVRLLKEIFVLVNCISRENLHFCIFLCAI